jgi:hypothetical protein
LYQLVIIFLLYTGSYRVKGDSIMLCSLVFRD